MENWQSFAVGNGLLAGVHFPPKPLIFSFRFPDNVGQFSQLDSCSSATKIGSISTFDSRNNILADFQSDSRRLSSLIDSLLQFKDNNSRQGSPAERDRASGFGGGDSSGGESERKNKRKSRVPTRATEMADIVYGEELEVFCGKQRGGTGAEPAVELGQVGRSGAEKIKKANLDFKRAKGTFWQTKEGNKDGHNGELE